MHADQMESNSFHGASSSKCLTKSQTLEQSLIARFKDLLSFSKGKRRTLQTFTNNTHERVSDFAKLPKISQQIDANRRKHILPITTVM